MGPRDTFARNGRVDLQCAVIDIDTRNRASTRVRMQMDQKEVRCSKAAKLLQVQRKRSGACVNGRTTCRCLADNQHRTSREFSLVSLLWRTGDFPRLKGLIAIPNISLTRDVMDVLASQEAADARSVWYGEGLSVGPSLQRPTGCV